MRTTGLAVVLLLGLAVLAAGCGGGGSRPAGSVPTSAEVLQCIEEGGGEKWPLVPTEPQGAPQHTQTAFAIGPRRGHIGVFLAKQPVFNAGVVKGYDRLGEYHATVVLHGRGLVILDPGIDGADRELIFECAEG